LANISGKKRRWKKPEDKKKQKTKQKRERTQALAYAETKSGEWKREHKWGWGNKRQGGTTEKAGKRKHIQKKTGSIMGVGQRKLI